MQRLSKLAINTFNPLLAERCGHYIKCDLCQDDGLYIGETSRPLSVRLQEHYQSVANPTAKSYKNMG
jgi:hypothetical protein